MLLMLDNYDSFTYTLVQYFNALDEEVVVRRNDEISIGEIKRLNPSRLVISPGPCSPNEAGISMKAVLEFYQSLPILGVCLGHQAIAQAMGADVVRAPKVMHGKTSTITHNNQGIFSGLPREFLVTRYHSLLVNEKTLPPQIESVAWVNEGQHKELMAIQMTDYPVFGVQFHPESVLTEQGTQLLSNFLDY